MGPELLGGVLVAAAAVCWAAAAILYRKGMVSVTDPLLGCWARAPLALLVMSAAWLASSAQPPPPSTLPVCVLAGILIGVSGDGLYMAALRDASVSTVYPIAYTYIVIASAAAVLLLGEKLTPGLLASVALVMAGVYAASRGGGGSTRIRGVLEVLGASLSWGLGVLAAKVAAEEAGPLQLNIVKLLVILVLLAPYAAPRAARATRTGLWWVMLGGILGIGVGDLLFYAGLPVLGAARSTIISTISLPASMALSALVLGERPTRHELAGSALIVAGIVSLVTLGG